MKCKVCKINEAKPLSIVCSENCNKIRLLINLLSNKYTPTYGCDNCRGDNGGRCTSLCRQEFSASSLFVKELYSLVKLAQNINK